MENLPNDSHKPELIKYQDVLIFRDEVAIIESLFNEIGPRTVEEFLDDFTEGIGILEGHVVQIQLESVKHFPKAILHCKHLKVLNIAGDLDSIPPEIGQITSLEKIFLNLLELKSIPREMGNLVNLKDLHLFILQNIPDIPESLGNLVNLESLRLEDCSKMATLPEALGNLVNLRVLMIAGCSNIIRLPISFRNLQDLVTLKLLGLPLVESLDWMENLVNLEDLDIRGLSSVHTLPDQIGQCKKLKKVDLHAMPLRTIPASLGNCPLIERLVITKTDIQEIPATFENLHNLRTWIIDNNCLESIKGNYEHLQVLGDLIISNNKLRSFPNVIENCRNIKDLYADNNEIHELPENIGSCISLAWLNADDNRITRIPESIGQLKGLWRLELNGNQIATVPASICNITRLKVLALKNNRLTRLPVELFDKPDMDLLIGGNPWEYPFDQMECMTPDEFRAFLKEYYRTHPEHLDSQVSTSETQGADAGANRTTPDGEGILQLVYGYVIPKNDGTVMPCLSITTRRFWDEQRRVPEMGEWESRYFPDELAAIEHVVDALGDDEVVEGIYMFHAGTPDGEARQARALALWGEQQFDELSLLHGEIVEKDLKPTLEKLGAVEVPQISEQLRGGYFSQ
jgi:Leucine-rich repeat (LRR) protein